MYLQLKKVKTICDVINSFKNLIQSKNIKDLYFPFSTYVVHGIPSRLGIKLNKTVYTDGSSDECDNYYNGYERLLNRVLHHFDNNVNSNTVEEFKIINCLLLLFLRN